MKLNEIIFIIIIITITYTMGFMIRGRSIKEEIKEETIRRMFYAISSGMVTVNHDKIEEIKAKQKSPQKTSIANPSEAITNQAVTNGVMLKSEGIAEDINSRVICGELSTNIPPPEEG